MDRSDTWTHSPPQHKFPSPWNHSQPNMFLWAFYLCQCVICMAVSLWSFVRDRTEYQWHVWKCVVMARLPLCSYSVIHVYNFPFLHSSFIVILQAAWIFIKRSAEYKPLQFLAFAFVYRIFEKLKSFEPSVSPTYTVSSLFLFLAPCARLQRN